MKNNELKRAYANIRNLKLDIEFYKNDLEQNLKMYKKYRWLYQVACEILHDTSDIPLEHIKDEIEKLWDLQNKVWERNKNGN